ncbi:MAG: TonB-dependent receptor [Acidobacteria bacterium]|nr:TonB-dependent receptor [Acidobacteriota bacterium]
MIPSARRAASVAAIFLLLILTCGPLGAQSERGTIAGNILDPTGAAVPGAKVAIVNKATNVAASTASNEVGAYAVPNLSPGDYSLRVEREGFKAASITGIVLNAASNVRADVTLEVGGTQQTVEVSASALVLQTDSAKSATVVTNKLVDELPTVVGGAMRSPFDLAILTPESKNFGDNNFQMGGGQAASFGVSLDGVSANTTRALTNSWVAVNTPSLEAITEFTVETNGFKAEYGHAGGGQMTFVSKSGSNQFHGSAYEFLRNTKLDANDWFANANKNPRRVYKQNDFGASAGGPVAIPKVYNGRDKTFFFFSYEAFRNRVGASSFYASVPTEEMYKGDFSKWVNANGAMIPIYDPFSLRTDASGKQIRDPFPGNQIATARFDPLSAKALAVFQQYGGVLKPNIATAVPGTVSYVTNNYVVSNGTEVNPQTKYSVKIDHNLSQKDRFSGYIGWNRTGAQPGPNGPRTLPGFYSDYNDLTRNSNVYRASWDHNFSPTLLNHFYGGGNDWKENHDPIQATIKSGIDWKDKICLPNAPNCAENLVNLRFGGYNGWGGPANNGSENAIYAFNNDTTWIHANHTFKFGGMFQQNNYNGFGRQDVAGRANFATIGTSVPGDTNVNTGGGNSFASFLLGWATDGGIDTVRYIGQQWPYFAGFFQDDWRVNRKLTVFLGLRWETTLPPKEEKDRWSDFSPTTPNPGAGGIPGALIYAGTGEGRQGSRTLADSWFGGYGPRFGLAYSLNDKTVIRANFARSFSAVTTTTGSTHQKGFTQTVGFGNTSTGISPTFLFKEGLPPYPVPPFISSTFQNGADMPWWQGKEATRLPEQNNINVSLQRQLGPSLVMDLSYNGVIGSHLQAGLLNYNQVPFAALEKYGAPLLNSAVDSPAAIAAGIKQPWPDFAAFWRSKRVNPTVAQALRPFPQYTTINTWDGGGDHSGHSGYHAAIVKLDKRFSHGVTFTTSYVLSKLLSDADSYWITDNPRAADHYNRRLEKSIGSYDVTHNFKFAGTYELPFGRGKRLVAKGWAARVVGDWRMAFIGTYSGGRPVGLGTSVSVPLFAGRAVPWIPSYDGWRAPTKGDKFDPAVDTFLQPASFFGPQPANTMGNQTRLNARLRELPSFNERFSISKLIAVREGMNFELRGEFFNAFNRVRMGVGNTNVTSTTFGKVTGVYNSPRQIQLGAKFVF